MIEVAPHDADPQAAAIAHLTRINLDDLIASFGWQDRALLAAFTRRLLRNPAQTFARQIAEFDASVGQDGLVSAARQMVSHYVGPVCISGKERIPAGPFLVLSNHPGMTDALSLFAALNRPDLLVVALERPFLQALPHMSGHLACLSEARSAPAAVVRQVTAHLRAGGAALSFPAGRIEPDPDVQGGAAAAALTSWTQSAGVFVRLAPETTILPVLVRGVVWPKAVHRCLARAGQATSGREKAAAAVQLLAHVVLKVRPAGASVQIGRPIRARDLGAAKTEVIHQAVLAEMSEMIATSPGRGG